MTNAARKQAACLRFSECGYLEQGRGALHASKARTAPDWPNLPDVDSHAARSALNASNCRVQIETVEIRHFDLGNLFDLLLGNFANFSAIWFRGTFNDSGSAQQQNGSWGSFQDKSKRAALL